MQRGASVRIFLVDGTPSGPRIVEKIGWTGHALMCSRAQYSSIRGRPEFRRTGVYVLVGDSPDGTDTPWLYIGETDAVGIRLDSHVKGKDEWNHFIVFTSKDGNLNKAHAKYIESHLVELARNAKRSAVANLDTPAAPQLSVAETADVHNFIDEMLLIYPLLGIRAFEQVSRVVPVLDGSTTPDLFLVVAGIKATGQDRPDGFVVFKGSQATKNPAPSGSRSSEGLRERLVADAVLVDDGQFFRFTEDYSFNSSSQAGMLVVGYPVSGPASWKDAKGRTLSQIQAATLG